MPNVLADTSVLIEFFRPGGREDVREEVGSLLMEHRLTVCGIVISELLQGVRMEEREPLQALLEEAHYHDFARSDYELAGEVCNALRKKGRKIPITDALIASLCIRLKLPLYVVDAHFDHFDGLVLHKPMGK